MAILAILLPMFFLLLGFGEIIGIRNAVSVSTGPIDLVVVLIFVVWFLFIKKSKYELTKPIAIFLSVATLSLVVNFFSFNQNQLFISSLYLVRVILYMSLYFVFVDIGKIFKDTIPKYFAFAGFTFILIGIFQYLFFNDLRPFKYLGWDIHINRLFSSFFDPNFAGIFLVFIFIFVFILREKIFSKKWIYLSYIFLFINFIAIILTYSRGAYLMLLVSVLVYSFLVGKWKLSAGLIGIFLVIFLILSPRFDTESTNLLRTASIEARLSSANEAISIWEKKPYGVGFNTYRYARDKYGVKKMSNAISNAGAGVDNSYVFVLVTTGIFGLFVYLYLLFRILRLGYDNAKKNKYALVLVVSLAGLMINALTINSLFYSYILLWIVPLVGFTESTLHE